MEFEFAHLLQPLSATGTLQVLPVEPGMPIDLRVEPAVPSHVADQSGSDWIKALLAVSNDSPVEDHVVELTAVAKFWAEEIAVEVPASDLSSLSDPSGGVAALGPLPAAVAEGEVDCRVEAQFAPARELQPGRSRFATPSVDDDLLPVRRKRR